MKRSEGTEAFRERAERLSLRSQFLGLKAEFLLLRLYRLALKAGYKPDQPRHPKGTPEGGQWSDTGGSPATPPREPRLTRDPATTPKAPRLKPPGIGHNNPPRSSVPRTPPDAPLETPPDIPKEQPSRPRQRTQVAKAVALWLLSAAAKRALGPIGLVIEVVELVGWLKDSYPAIESSFDGPRTLEELRSLADERAPGYEVHHIVERASAYEDGYPRSMVEDYDNLVRVPTYRHHEITGWYQRPNADFEGLSPREYLRGKPWDERMRVGLDVLVELGVMK